MVWIGGPLYNLQPSSGARPVSMPVAYAGVRSMAQRLVFLGQRSYSLSSIDFAMFPPKLVPDVRQEVILVSHHEFDGIAPCEHCNSFV
jgi:hypothetical protein